MSGTRTVKEQIFTAFAVFLALIIVSSPAMAQRTMTLAEAMAIGLTQSNTIALAQFDFDQQRMNLESSKGRLKTSMRLNFTLPQFNKEITAIETGDATIFRDDRSLRSDGSLTITQPFVAMNGTFRLSATYRTLNQERETSTGLQETNTWTDNIGITYTQPLFEPNTRRNELERNERNFTLSERSFVNTENNIWFEVQQRFYSVYRAKRQLEIQEQNYQNIEQNYQVSLNKFQAGILAAVDKMQWEVDLAVSELDLINQQLNYSRQKDQFKRYIGMDINEDFDPLADIAVTPIEIDEAKAVEEAFKNSVSLLSSEYSILNQKDNFEVTKVNDRIRVDFELSYGLNERDDFGKIWKNEWDWTNQLFKDFSQTNAARINLSVPIFDSGVRKNTIASSEVGIRRSERNLENQRLDFRQQIETIFDTIDNARQRINTSSGSVAVAEEQYSISQQRFEIGDITSDQLFTSNTRLTSAREGSLSAQIDYLLAIADLYNETFWDFENNRPLNETVQTFKR